MKHIIIPALLLAVLCTGCQTYVSKTGAKHRQLLPARDRSNTDNPDTNRYMKRSFSLADYTNKIACRGKKKIIEPMEGADINTLVMSKERYYLYFWNPVCRGMLSDIHRLDSFSKTGAHVLVISMRRNYDAMDRVLGKTSFSQYPYYTLESKRYSNTLLVRKIRFLKEACSHCYEQYKDDLAMIDYLLIENGTIRPVMFNERNILND